MRILLTTLNSKYIHSNLALRYLYALTGEYKRQTRLLEFTINNHDGYIFNEILRGEYDVVFFSCYIWNIQRTLYLAETLKQAVPGIKIALGGPEVGFDAVPIMTDHKWVDFILSGEGENNFPKLLAALHQENAPLERIKGLTYRKGGKIYVNPPSGPVDFNSVPFPYEDTVLQQDKIIYYESARGCPFSCSYCISSLDKHMRPLSIERVKKELSFFLKQRVKQVKFIDRTFNWKAQRCSEIFSFLIENDNGKTNFHFEICGELLTVDQLELISKARPGLFQFEIGVQSTSRKTLEACRRQGDFDLLSQNVKKLLAMGNVHIHLDLIAGLPYEDYDSFKQSFNDVYKLKPHMLQIGFLKLLRGTFIRDHSEEHEYVYHKNAPYEVISNKYISPYGIARLKRIETVFDLFYNRRGFEHTLDFAGAHFGATPFDFYQELSDFYYLKGYQHRSHSKEDLYRILKDYIRWKGRFVADIEETCNLLLERDMTLTLTPEAVKKFDKKGWELLG